jgi:hypothetical protein
MSTRRDLGAYVALFVLILVGLVVTLTWLDWRDTNRKWVFPEWAKGMALGGVLAASLAAVSSCASLWIRDGAGQSNTGTGFEVFWMELVFLLTMMGIIVFAARKRKLRLVLLLGCVIIAAFWFGITL